MRAFVCISLWVSPQLMFEAVPRVGLSGAATMTRAGTIIGTCFHDDPDEARALSGFWDVPDTVSEDDRQAFMAAWEKAAAAAKGAGACD